MRILIACRAIDNMAGGVERQAIALAHALLARGHHLSFLTFDLLQAQSFFDIDPRISWYKLAIGNPKIKAGWVTRVKRRKATRHIIRQARPDVILPFQQGMFLSLRIYTIGMGVPIIAAERESPFRYDFIKAGKYRRLIFQSFRLAPCITVQCPSYVEAYPAYLRAKIAVIPNSVFPAADFAQPGGEQSSRKILLCVGRLGYQKNQLVLLEAFAKLRTIFPDWDLWLAGEGEGRPAIEKKITEYNLDGRVKLWGAVKDISAFYSQAHLFCLPARWEGFPNVLAESLAHGLPAVGFAGCGGVRDLIAPGKNGVLAAGNGDPDSLRQALQSLMEASDLRVQMGKYAVESVRQYQPKIIYDQWENVLHKVKK